MMELFDVFIGGVLAGKIGKPPRRPVVFQFVEEYRRAAWRPVLGQRFEDGLRKKYWGEAQELPAFFANLIPEGRLRDVLVHSLKLPVGDDLALLAAVGHDLPGAVEIRPTQSGADLLDATYPAETTITEQRQQSQEPVFRFSLAGVQMKFSVLLDTEKLRLPMSGELGNWIAKFDSRDFPDLPANEFAIMEWARIAGFDVPACRLLSAIALPQELVSEAKRGDKVFLIQRYDRVNNQRIHQEDFAQVAGLRPDLKYEHWSYEICARVVREVCGNAQYEEFIRRLVFMVASGNTDAHLKNWSLLYPDGVNAVLTPLYDQVAVVAWQPPEPRMQTVWALNFAGSKQLDKIDETAFRRLAERSGGNPERVMQLVTETLSKLMDAWHNGQIAEILPTGHAQALQLFWTKVPLLKKIFS